jgi:hypothetical protein
VSGDADKLLELVQGLAGKAADKVEVDEALLRKFASGEQLGVRVFGSVCGPLSEW